MLWRDGTIWKSFLFVNASLGVLLGWAFFVPLSEGVAASGKIVVESDRQVIQHLEGGIVERIYVVEGDIVEQGMPLLELTSSATEASYLSMRLQAASLTLSENRILALMSGSSSMEDTELSPFKLDADEEKQVYQEQTNLFAEQREAHEASISLLTQRRDAASQRADLRDNEKQSVSASIDVIEEELFLAESLVEKQMGKIDRVRALERERSNYGSTLARLITEISSSRSEAEDFQAQIVQAQSRFQQELASELVETRRQLEEVMGGVSMASDQMVRFTLTAPRSGKVFNLNFNTVGGVVRPGEAIMEIVPSDQGVRASVRIKPTDRAQVFGGLSVRTVISAYSGWQAEPLLGRVTNVSADLKIDPVSGAQYYEAEIALDTSETEPSDRIEILPGMPVQAFIYSGKKRTTFDYLLAPVLESFFKGLRSS